MNAPSVSTQELYLELSMNDYGTQIFITDNGDIETMEPNTYDPNENRIYFGRALGDWIDEDWGIQYHTDDDTGKTWYTIDTLNGQYENREDAFITAIKEFGLPDHIHQHLLDRLEETFRRAKI